MGSSAQTRPSPPLKRDKELASSPSSHLAQQMLSKYTGVTQVWGTRESMEHDKWSFPGTWNSKPTGGVRPLGRQRARGNLACETGEEGRVRWGAVPLQRQTGTRHS